MSTNVKEKLGLIAGNGKFPLVFAKKAREQNFEVIAAGIKGDTSLFLKPFVNQLSSFHVGELKKMFEYFKAAQVKKVIMAGQVNPDHLFQPGVVLDAEFKNLFEALKDRKADTIFAAIGEKLKDNGMELCDSTFLIKDHLAPPGTLSKRGPTSQELDDITFGRDIAKAMGGLDVGQTVVIKDKAIVAIEAMEGTDRCILRGGEIARTGAVVVKMSKPNQDLRFDVPVIGPRTLKNMARVKASCLAIETGKTIIIDRETCLKIANKSGICLLAA